MSMMKFEISVEWKLWTRFGIDYSMETMNDFLFAMFLNRWCWHRWSLVTRCAWSTKTTWYIHSLCAEWMAQFSSVDEMALRFVRSFAINCDLAWLIFVKYSQHSQQLTYICWLPVNALTGHAFLHLREEEEKKTKPFIDWILSLSEWTCCAVRITITSKSKSKSSAVFFCSFSHQK